MKREHAISVVLSLLMVALAPSAFGWLRAFYEDATVVERSELIVIGHLKEASVECVPHKRKPGRGTSWEHHARLVITEALKGKSSHEEIPIIIHYGLTPVVDGVSKRGNTVIQRQRHNHGAGPFQYVCGN